MANIPVAPFVLNDVVLTIGANTYQDGLNEVTFAPTTATTVVYGMSPTANYTVAGQTTWTCTIAGYQDLETTNSFWNYLFSNSASASGTFKPRAGGTKTVSFTFTPVKPTIGGQQGSVATFSVQLPLTGVPTVA